MEGDIQNSGNTGYGEGIYLEFSIRVPSNKNVSHLVPSLHGVNEARGALFGCIGHHHIDCDAASPPCHSSLWIALHIHTSLLEWLHMLLKKSFVNHSLRENLVNPYLYPHFQNQVCTQVKFCRRTRHSFCGWILITASSGCGFFVPSGSRDYPGLLCLSTRIRHVGRVRMGSDESPRL